MRYNIWKYLMIYSNNMDFDILENNILMFDKMKNQGVLKDGIEKAINENKYSISATFKGVKEVHKLVLVGISIDKRTKNPKYGLVDIFANDIKIDGNSIFDDGHVFVDVV